MVLAARSSLAVAALCALLPACSADAVDEPVPALETPGTFIASARKTDGYDLFRTRTVLFLDDRRTYLFFDEHLDGAATLDEARSKAQDPALALTFVGPRLRSNFLETSWHVVWYRSLTKEERAAHGGL